MYTGETFDVTRRALRRASRARGRRASRGPSATSCSSRPATRCSTGARPSRTTAARGSTCRAAATTRSRASTRRSRRSLRFAGVRWLTPFDLAIVGGGLVGAAIAFGLRERGLRIAMLDEGDRAHRASRGNFGLIWVQGKGARPARVRQLDAGLRAPVAEARLRSRAGDRHRRRAVAAGRRAPVPVRAASSTRAPRSSRRCSRSRDSSATGSTSSTATRSLRRLPGLGPDVVGGSWSDLDGHCNPLRLLDALHAGVRARGHRATGPAPPCASSRRTAARSRSTPPPGSCARSASCSPPGLGNARLAPMVGLRAPVVPEPGPDHRARARAAVPVRCRSRRCARPTTARCWSATRSATSASTSRSSTDVLATMARARRAHVPGARGRARHARVGGAARHEPRRLPDLRGVAVVAGRVRRRPATRASRWRRCTRTGSRPRSRGRLARRPRRRTRRSASMFARLPDDARRRGRAHVRRRARRRARGDSVAAALIAPGHVGATASRRSRGRPRGPWCLMGACHDCLVDRRRRAERAGLHGRRRGGHARRHAARRARDRRRAHPTPASPSTTRLVQALDAARDDRAISTSRSSAPGPAGLAAATVAARMRPRASRCSTSSAAPGGQIHRGITRVAARARRRARRRLLGGRRAGARVRALRRAARRRARACGRSTRNDDATLALAVSTGPPSSPSSRLVHARAVIAAPGAIERPVPVPGWTLPGVMTRRRRADPAQDRGHRGRRAAR